MHKAQPLSGPKEDSKRQRTDVGEEREKHGENNVGDERELKEKKRVNKFILNSDAPILQFYFTKFHEIQNPALKTFSFQYPDLNFPQFD